MKTLFSFSIKERKFLCKLENKPVNLKLESLKEEISLKTKEDLRNLKNSVKNDAPENKKKPEKTTQKYIDLIKKNPQKYEYLKGAEITLANEELKIVNVLTADGKRGYMSFGEGLMDWQKKMDAKQKLEKFYFRNYQIRKDNNPVITDKSKFKNYKISIPIGDRSEREEIKIRDESDKKNESIAIFSYVDLNVISIEKKFGRK